MSSVVVSPARPDNHELLRIGSKRVDTPGRIEVRDPATGTIVGSCANASTTDVVAAVDAAQAAYRTWGRTTASDRAGVLHDIAEAMVADEPQLARLVTAEVGKPLAESSGEVDYAAEFAHWYAEEARRVSGRVTIGGPDEPWRQLVRQPIGVVGAITPWNYPLVLSARKAFAAIAAGCTVVLKPSELAPLSVFRLGMLAQQAGLPDGVLNIVTASPPTIVGDVFSTDPRVRKISFTGSVATGKTLMRAAARTLTRVGLELGGNNAFLVFEDADLDLAVRAAVVAKLRNGGQTCVCANRFLVHESVLTEFADRLAEALGGKVVGSGSDPATEVGPMINQRAVDRIRVAVDQALANGATAVRATNNSLPDGPYYPPTVLLDVDADSTLMTEEIFGPVAPVTGFHDFEQAIDLANDTEYGLAAYVFTASLRTAMRASEELETGIVIVNRAAPSGVEFPQGGVKQSGIGLEGGPEGLADFTTSKFVTLGG
ncbi:MAG TPA: NAD-dependent succinate-semialdehyde dehydrogenase [Pseudonocardiaceae bacterium]